MAVKLNSLKNDLDKERDGEWIKSPQLGPDVEFNVRSTNLPAYVIARDHANQKLQRKYKGDPIPPKEAARVYGALLVDHLLIDWKGMVDDDEQPIKYDADVGRDILTMKPIVSCVARSMLRQTKLVSATSSTSRKYQKTPRRPPLRTPADGRAPRLAHRAS